MIGIGTVVMKIAGRDAGRIGVVIGIKDGFVLIDGEVRRREVSVNHIEPAGQSVSVSEGASTEAVRDALKGLGLEFPEPFANKRPRVGGPKPVKLRAADRRAVEKPKKAVSKKTVKKAPAKSASKAQKSKSDPKSEKRAVTDTPKEN
jgi:ribosomal protein L14E/L6E/L27E